MNFRIADTFTDSLARLTSEEQKLVKTTAFDLQMNPVNPGMAFHKIDKSKDKNFWSVRVGSDIRLIVHKVQDSLLLCFVDHHDRGPLERTLRIAHEGSQIEIVATATSMAHDLSAGGRAAGACIGRRGIPPMRHLVSALTIPAMAVGSENTPNQHPTRLQTADDRGLQEPWPAARCRTPRGLRPLMLRSQ